MKLSRSEDLILLDVSVVKSNDKQYRFDDK